jgi:hypothetical protein
MFTVLKVPTFHNIRAANFTTVRAGYFSLGFAHASLVFFAESFAF